MSRILLVCLAGMSTSLLVTKMQSVADEHGIECSIKTVGEAELKKYENEIDILLLAPQVRYLLNKMKTRFETRGIPVEVINTLDYGTMNGEKVLKQALSMINK
ncbi:PTS sugar transporter subunit IIB [Clostridium sp. AL.422]|uniref:PTS sugar transporter subunit IIB n=1 Tax=Clostridium TaxID=1485 RepID=UPI00293DBB0D|nr:MULTISPECIES: PTS sugar transporter subunit IIB [unclassified Clostridium]MDV4149626.1 PTS sugar transporter subunit IIB [Clostridium sp. AL.422]